MIVIDPIPETKFHGAENERFEHFIIQTFFSFENTFCLHVFRELLGKIYVDDCVPVFIKKIVARDSRFLA